MRSTPQLPREELRLRPIGIHGTEVGILLVGQCIVLEDDDVPAVSFFGFCKELLDKYEHDTRISMIAGFNNEEITPDITSDYFFATTFSIWGWASWRRGDGPMG